MDLRDRDEEFIVLACDQLNNYLGSQVLFWPVGLREVTLTVGNLLLSMQRLSIFNSSDLHCFEEMKTIRQIQHEKRAIWFQKANAELPARIREWAAFVKDLRSGEESWKSIHSKLRIRAVIDLLIEEVQRIPIRSEIELQQVDDYLRLHFSPGEMIWGDEYEKAFSRDHFWFLYSDFEENNK